MRVIPAFSRFALSLVLAFALCAAPYSLAFESGRLSTMKQEAHAVAPAALAGLAASAGVTPEVAAAAIGALVASVAGVSLYELSNSKGTSVADEAEGYLLLGQATGRLPDFSEPSPPDPNNQDGNDPESRGNKLKAVVAALGASAGATVAFSALDNLVDTVFDWVTTSGENGGSDTFEVRPFQNLTYMPGFDSTPFAGFAFYPDYVHNGETYTPIFGYQASGNVFCAKQPLTFDQPLLVLSKGDGISNTMWLNNSTSNGGFHIPDYPYSTYNQIAFNTTGYKFNGGKFVDSRYNLGISNPAIFNANLSYRFFVRGSDMETYQEVGLYSQGYLTLPDGTVYTPTGDLLNSLISTPEIIDDTVSQYGFATSTESQLNILNRYLNDYVNVPAVGDKVTVITIPTISPEQATYPDYKTEVSPEQVTPIKPKPDTPDSPTAPADVKKRFEEICGLAFGSVFPFCLIEDLKQLWNKISVSSEPDFKVILPTANFGVQGAEQVVIDASDLAVLGGYVRGFLNLLFVAGLLVLSFRLFLNRGGE